MKGRRSKQVMVSGSRGCQLTREEEHDLVANAVRKAKDGDRVIIDRKAGCIDVRVVRRETIIGSSMGGSVAGATAAAPPAAPVLLGTPDTPPKEGT